MNFWQDFSGSIKYYHFCSGRASWDIVFLTMRVHHSLSRIIQPWFVISRAILLQEWWVVRFFVDPSVFRPFRAFLELYQSCQGKTIDAAYVGLRYCLWQTLRHTIETFPYGFNNPFNRFGAQHFLLSSFLPRRIQKWSNMNRKRGVCFWVDNQIHWTVRKKITEPIWRK